MKNSILLTCICLLMGFYSLAQLNDADADDRKGKFKREHMFFGSSLNLSLGNRFFNIGINPELGYSVTKWLDAGVALNVNYFSQNASEFSSYRFRNFNYGAGTFLRIWPVNFLHLQVQPEYNWISSSRKEVISGQTDKFNLNAGSLLVGIGYGSRMIGNQYQYVTLMIDVLQNINSPYRDQFNDPLPVFRAGFGVYFNRKK
ncbi:MAG: hypothetical protein IBJ16_14020 [Chitinophagaceae bacterium]|nr:hypothetical protein [Chitinophagaceae bacterium]